MKTERRSIESRPFPALGRFIQADTLAPQPGNSLAWDRYGYVLNNPLRFTDPSGYYFCEGAASCEFNDYHTYAPGQLLSELLIEYGITLQGEGWEDYDRMYQAALAVTSTGRALAGNLDGSAAKAFTDIYGEMVFEWNEQCYGCRSEEQNRLCGADFWSEGCKAHGGVTLNSHHVMFASMAKNILYARNHIVHELGHAINGLLGGKPYKAMDEALRKNGDFDRPDRWSNYGFSSPGFPWQQAYVNVNTCGEIWADQFVGWVFTAWENSARGQLRSAWMITNMAEFLN